MKSWLFATQSAQLGPSSGSHQGQLRYSEAASAHSTQDLHSPGHLPPDLSSSQRAGFFFLLTASFSGKEKGWGRPKSRGQCLQCIYLAGAEERGCAFRASGLTRLPAGRIDHGAEEDIACGDSCPRSSPLADRQAGRGQKLYVLKLFLNQKPQDSADFVVVV